MNTEHAKVDLLTIWAQRRLMRASDMLDANRITWDTFAEVRRKMNGVKRHKQAIILLRLAGLEALRNPHNEAEREALAVGEALLPALTKPFPLTPALAAEYKRRLAVLPSKKGT